MKKEKLEIIYTIGVILAIPALVTLNTILLVRSTRSAFNNELRRKADLVNAVIAESAATNLKAGNFDLLGNSLQHLEISQPAITGTRIIRQTNGTPNVVARATSASDQLDIGTKLQIQIAYERKLPIAKLVNLINNGQKAQAWNVITPAVDSTTKEVIAVVSTNILTTDAQEAIDKAFATSFLVLIVSIIVIIALLFRHFRLVGNIQLLARQREINQTMSDFLSVATHELKAPASIIKGYVSNVMDGMYGPINDEINDQLKTAVGQTDRLNGLVQDLLNVSRIEQGRVEYTYSAVDSTKLLAMIYENYKIFAVKKGLVLKLETNAPMPLVKADEGRLQEVFTNIIDNAIKYTAKGTVTISQRSDHTGVLTTIKDTGFGLSAEARKRLFQRFYRVKTEETKGIGGTGLGLWIIKQYITAMDGKIDVESMEGAGSAFIVTMPLNK